MQDLKFLIVCIYPIPFKGPQCHFILLKWSCLKLRSNVWLVWTARYVRNTRNSGDLTRHYHRHIRHFWGYAHESLRRKQKWGWAKIRLNNGMTKTVPAWWYQPCIYQLYILDWWPYNVWDSHFVSRASLHRQHESAQPLYQMNHLSMRRLLCLYSCLLYMCLVPFLELVYVICILVLSMTNLSESSFTVLGSDTHWLVYMITLMDGRGVECTLKSTYFIWSVALSCIRLAWNLNLWAILMIQTL